MDGIPARDLGGFGYRSVPFFSQTNSTTPKIKYRETCRVWYHIKQAHPQTKPRFQPSTTILIWIMLIVCRRTRSFLDLVRCCNIFEDYEAVIEMIIKGRSPTKRHVSRTHRVALDWLFDRMNLDPNIQIKYVDTKHQLADMLTKGNFTRDEWNNLLYLFDIFHFSPLCCAQNISLTSCTRTMANRMQEQKGDNRIVAKSKADDD